MPLPSKHEILRRAKKIALERQVRTGLPAVTPTEKELKETGVFQEAKLDLMRVDQEALSQQRHYLEDMASEMRLKVIPKRGLATLRKETGYEWTNGWTKHKKHKPKPPPIPLWKKKQPSKSAYNRVTREAEKFLNENYPRHYYTLYRVEAQKMGFMSGEAHQFAIYHSYKRMRKEVEPRKREMQRVNLRKPLDIGSAIIGAPKPKKKKKRHVGRTGKTMRVLKKVNGVKMFSFPDSVWKVRKPRRKKK